MKVLVTGAAGLYGVHTVEELVSKKEITKIFGFDDFSRGFPPDNEISNDKWGTKAEIFKHRYQDLTAKELDSLEVDVIIHLAGYNLSKESMNIPEEYFLNNEYGMFKLIQTLVRTKKRPFLIFASTTEVYGTPLYTPIDEKHPTNPGSIMAVTKLAAEKHLIAFSKLYNYPVTIMRFTNTFGENQNICNYYSVVSSFIDKALKNEPLIIYGTGEQSRDFIYVKDAVRAFYLAIVNRRMIEGLVINIAGGKLTSINELAGKIKKLTNSTSEIIKLPFEKGDIPGAPIDNSLASKLLLWSKQYSLDEGLARTILWYKSLRCI